MGSQNARQGKLGVCLLVLLLLRLKIRKLILEVVLAYRALLTSFRIFPHVFSHCHIYLAACGSLSPDRTPVTPPVVSGASFCRNADLMVQMSMFLSNRNDLIIYQHETAEPCLQWILEEMLNLAVPELSLSRKQRMLLRQAPSRAASSSEAGRAWTQQPAAGTGRS